MCQDDDFYTLRGYDRQETRGISPTMEDYLEMICRCAQQDEYVRVNLLAAKLHVTPPSSSKMVHKLKEEGMVQFEPYGIVQLTEKGWKMGNYLLYRHDVLHRFFCFVNHSDNELELVERIEHFIDEDTVRNIESLLHRNQR